MFKTIVTICLVVFTTLAFGDDSISKIELTQPSIDYDVINRVWHYLKKRTNAPIDLPPPPIVLDWQVPKYARMGFQYPTKEFPNNLLQISIAPRTIDLESRDMVTWGLLHELTHYIFVLRENNWDTTRKVYTVTLKHHCNKEFMMITRELADRIWDVYHADTDKSKMYQEVIRSCGSHPDQ
jgi:hypothetical protein